MHRHDLGGGDNIEIWRAFVPGELSFDQLFVTDQNHFDAEFLGRKQSPLDDHVRSVVSTHRVDGNFRHMGSEIG